MIREEIRQVRNDLLDWAMTKPDEVRYRAAIIVGNLHRLEHWPDDRPMLLETLRNIAALEALRAVQSPGCASATARVASSRSEKAR
jgi:hypothetical protein